MMIARTRRAKKIQTMAKVGTTNANVDSLVIITTGQTVLTILSEPTTMAKEKNDKKQKEMKMM